MQYTLVLYRIQFTPYRDHSTPSPKALVSHTLEMALPSLLAITFIIAVLLRNAR